MIKRNLPAIAFAILLFVFSFTKEAFSQDKTLVTFGKINPKDFNLPNSTAIDSNSNAVIIANVGSLEFVGNKSSWISYVYKKHIRIKILNSKAYDLATESIRLYGEDDMADKIDNISATTYNLVNGKVVETKLSANDIFTKKITKRLNEKRFTMPDVKEGCIIEYTFTIISGRYYYLPSWSFQNINYPCLYSEFKIGIPGLVKYSILRYGIDSFFSTKNDEKFETLLVNSGTSMLSVSTNVYNHTWIMKNIPAFKSEDYINRPEDYSDRIEFSITQTNNGEDVKNLRTTWKNAENGLLQSSWFGNTIKAGYMENLVDVADKICPQSLDPLNSAKTIYKYVRDNFTCTPDNEIYIDQSLYDINKSHKGGVEELNMLLIGLLRLHELHADPVILSTKEFGMHPVGYPALEKMNYVICMLRLGTDTIYLDASDPLLGFGKLNLSCYNGHAEIIDENHSGSVFFYPGNIKEQSSTFVTIVNDENGNGKSASFESTPGYFESYDLRSKIKEKGEEKYISDIKKSYGPDYEINNFIIDSLNMLDYPVKIRYDINFKANNDEDIIYFNPFIGHGYKENIFKAATRKYALEMPYPIDDTYELSMDLPKGYKVDELPKTAKVSFNATDGFFEYVTSKDQYLVQMRTHIKLLPAVFSAQDYIPLRDFFSYIVKKESEQVVFKKN